MHEIEAAIRAKLDEFCTTDMCAEDGKAALLAVLDLHSTDENHMCIKDIVGYSVQAWYDDEPCPTVLAIAEGLERRQSE